MPTGARKVTYFINQYGEGVEVNTRIMFDLTISGEKVDAAAEAGMAAFVATLQDANPTPVHASREYEGGLTGEPWPAP